MNTNTVVLRSPSPKGQDSGLSNLGVGFCDTVTLEGGEKKMTIHLLPEKLIAKGETMMVFPGRGRALPEELTGHTKAGDRQPGYVLYHKDRPVGSGWLHQGKKLFLVLKMNHSVPMDEGEQFKLTVFPRFVKEKGAA
jgi:hypothetical protein